MAWSHKLKKRTKKREENLLKWSETLKYLFCNLSVAFKNVAEFMAPKHH